ncbi:sugar ABC transporter ATP-binding protein [Paraburkholderia phenoliruptrix]|uniref:Ribose import ATP-binding protein RbsA n=2 Tax=Paraburkholderia phenoliruptrix TaxID=252970 RepID=K0DX48_9BURK|nr:sugar ABC transporter ATP-binding protein [Paraburkholderia phenoliruptrix]AFT87899.1 Ribose import ATP-binding protein RbsA [Paraburkholderia phenoliruptrix BR3459a]MDR6418135.1 rhamnose transport system ATP-binding protein [Paraburkholderia phenoliruptrix]WMY12341.1 sugar ABC transporter ATP-binding protein [Paraburkholderia phenoliruptrix]CAB4046804.1 Ribose import ATP-binding protein RbsA [Paraburkholderia phenoliruptrix]
MQPPSTAQPRLELRHASKSFGRVRALSDGDLALWPGEVHALLGENGAGKSTLVKILAGVHQPDSGELVVDGVARRFATPAEARDAGLAVIYQEPTLFFDLSIAENIFMGRQPVDRIGRIQYDAMRREVDGLLASLGVDLRADQLVRGLSIADQQVIEIAKALSLNANVLIMDEPTAALSLPEVERLFAIVRKLRERDVAILFITHRLDEVFALTQRVTIMRDGAKVFDGLTADLTTEAIVAKMVGRDLETFYPKAERPPGEVRLSVRGLTRVGVFKDISFDVREGEIVALAGLVGAGRSEVARAIFGIDPLDAGEIMIGGQRLSAGSPAAAVRAGLALVPEDRRQQGLALELSIARNASMTVLGRLVKHGLITARSETALANRWGTRLRLKAGDPNAPVGTLSGGNQQKVVLGKWLATGPKVLIIDEPTRGIDVGAKAEVYSALAELVRDGMAVLMISSELPEVLGMADRVLVMHEGRISADIARAEADEERIMAAALGQPIPPLGRAA